MLRLREIDWRILLGVGITVIWLLLGITYFLNQDGTIWEIPIENLGSFLEGGFAPLAFMWLVIGLFIQQKELADNTEVMRQSMEMSKKQAEVLEATEISQRQEAFFKIAENVKRQLGSIAGMLFISRFGATEGDIVAPEKILEMWHMLSTGDAEVFPRAFLAMTFEDYGGGADIFYGTQIRANHSRNFIQVFDKLMRLAEQCDADGVITGTLTQTAHGLFYNILKSAASDAGHLVDASDYEQIVSHGKG